MISVSTELEGAMIVATMSGKIQSADYEDSLVPAIERALAEHDSIRMLVIAGDDFEGYDMGAAWADTKLGLSHWRGFDRVAVATDRSWMQTAIRMASPILPCPVQVFPAMQEEDARRWLLESLGALHVIDLGGSVIQVQLLGDVDAAAYQRAEGDLDAKIQDSDGFRLLLDLTQFTGRQGISALSAHFNLALEHAPIAERVAILGNKNWQRLAERVGDAFLKADVRFFDEADANTAKNWLTS